MKTHCEYLHLERFHPDNSNMCMYLQYIMFTRSNKENYFL